MKSVKIIDFLTRILWGSKEGREFRRYPYIIEIRPVLEKYKIKEVANDLFREIRCGRFSKVPHLTLVYSFRILNGNEFEVAKMMKKVVSKYDLVKFYYRGIRLKKGDKGLVVALDIEPTEELKELRRELYNALKPTIKSRED